MAVNSCNLFYYLLYTMFTCFVFGENHNSTSKSHSIGMSKEEKMSLRQVFNYWQICKTLFAKLNEV